MRLGGSQVEEKDEKKGVVYRTTKPPRDPEWTFTGRSPKRLASHALLKNQGTGTISTFAERSWRPAPNPSSGDQDPALLTCRAVSPRGWGSGTLPSQLSLVSYLVALGPAPPSGRWDAARGEKSGKKLAEPRGPASLPSPPPIRGWRGRRHACALSASSRLQRGKMWW